MYRNMWLAFVDVKAMDGNRFTELIDFEGSEADEYIGAWGNMLIVSDRINDVPSIIESGLRELGLCVQFIDKIENVGSLHEYDQLQKSVINEADWLLASGYVFKISDKLFPYLD